VTYQWQKNVAAKSEASKIVWQKSMKNAWRRIGSINHRKRNGIVA